MTVQGGIGKDEAIRRHAERRARERYGGVPEETVRRIKRLIERCLRTREDRTITEAGLHVCLQCGRRQERGVWRVRIGVDEYRVVYERPTGRIVTFLPKNPTRRRG